MIIRFIGEIAQNILAVILILITIFLVAKNSRRFRRFVLPISTGFVGVSFMLIFMHKVTAFNLSANSYEFFYNFLTILLYFVKSLNYMLTVLLFNALSLFSAIKVLLMMINVQDLILPLIIVSNEILNVKFEYSIKLEDQDVLEWFINFGSNKNLHTFKQERVVFNC